MDRKENALKTQLLRREASPLKQSIFMDFFLFIYHKKWRWYNFKLVEVVFSFIVLHRTLCYIEGTLDGYEDLLPRGGEASIWIRK